MRLTQVEYEGWVRHFKLFPPGDYYTHKILAELWSAVVGIAGGKTRSPYEVAPHLEPAKRRKERQHRHKVARAQHIRAAWENTKKQRQARKKEAETEHD